MLRVKRQRSEALRCKDWASGSDGGGRRWRAANGILGDAAGRAANGGVARKGSWPVGKKPVIKLLGLNGGGGSVDGPGLLEGSVDSEKVAGHRDMVRGRHCARLVMLWCCGGGSRVVKV
jgi:hypothetical protein